MRRLAMLGRVPAALPTGASALSTAAECPVAQEIGRRCGGPGSIDPASVIATDPTGGGRPDFAIAHQGIGCEGGPTGRRAPRGIVVSAVQIHVRRGARLETPVDKVAGHPPAVRRQGDDGARHAMHRNAGGFR